MVIQLAVPKDEGPSQGGPEPTRGRPSQPRRGYSRLRCGRSGRLLARPSERHIPDILSIAAEDMLADATSVGAPV